VATDPQLIVALEARLDKFEKALKEAGVIAEQQVKEIEQKFAGMEITPGKIAGGVALGNVIFKALEKAVEGFIGQITKAIDEMNALNDVIGRTGITSEQFQQALFIGRRAGVSDAAIVRDVETLATKFDELNIRQTRLGELLDANNIKYRDATGRVVDHNKQWEIAAELISRAVGPAQLAEVERLLGVSREWTKELGKGAEHLSQMRAEAPVQDLENARKATEALRNLFGEIRALTGEWGGSIATLVLPRLVAAGEVVSVILEGLARITKGGVIEEQTQALLDKWTRIAAAIHRAGIEAGVVEGPSLKIRVQKAPLQFGAPTEADRDALTRFDEQLSKHVKLLEAEASTLGLTVGEREKARQSALLTEAAERSGVDAAAALTAERQKQIDQAAALVQKNAEIKASIDALNSASKEFGSALADAFKGMVLEGKKLDEVLKNLANRMASKAIDRLFDLLFAPAPGQGQSIFTKLLGITARQAGGPLAAGQAAIVGERGPELFIPGKSGMVIPNNAISGGGGAVEVKIINNTGAPVAKQETRGPNGRVLEITVGRMVRETISADLFQGGDIDRAMRTRFGLTPRLA
jgi:hypothetical protein